MRTRYSALLLGLACVACQGILPLQAFGQQPVRIAGSSSGQPLVSLPEQRTRTFPSQILDVGPHHKVINYVVTSTNAGGTIATRNVPIQVLGSGMNFQDAAGDWYESKARFVPVAHGFVASDCNWKLRLADNLNGQNAWRVRVPGGDELTGEPAALGFRDTATGQRVYFAEPQDCAGQLKGTDKVVYGNVYPGVDIVYSLENGRWEEDLLIRDRAAIPDPKLYNLNPATVVLESWSEWRPVRAPKHLTSSGGGGAPDEHLDFGNGLLIGAGSARLLEPTTLTQKRNQQQALASFNVNKQWVVGPADHGPARQFLVESLSYPDIEKQLQTLVANQGANLNSPARSRQQAALPKPLPSKARERAVATAYVEPTSRVLDLDFVLLQNQQDFTFSATNTYIINQELVFTGNVTIEGGTVIKNTRWSVLDLYVDSLTCTGTTQSAAIFTATDDMTVGQPTYDYAFMTGKVCGYYGSPFYLRSSQSPVHLEGLQFRYATYGLQVKYCTNWSLNNSSFTDCYRAIVANANFTLSNVVFSNNRTLLRSDGSTFTGTWNSVTGSQNTVLSDSTCTNGTLALSNCSLTVNGAGPIAHTGATLTTGGTPNTIHSSNPGNALALDWVWIQNSLSIYWHAYNDSDGWNWGSSNPSPLSNSTAYHISPSAGGIHQHWVGDTTAITFASNDVLYAYVYLPANDPPAEIMLQVLAEDDWHRVSWGADQISYAKTRLSTQLPSTGQWVRLEVPAAQAGLVGYTIFGVAFTCSGGTAYWDKCGVVYAGYDDVNANGVSDTWERSNFGHLLSAAELAADDDGDGLSNFQEFQRGTDPHNPDTDYDGRSDAQEVADGTDPTNPASVIPAQLGHWKFDDWSFAGTDGQLPIWASWISLQPSWSSNALSLPLGCGKGLVYRDVESNGHANINCRNGTIRFWFQPNWSTGPTGGPQTYARLIESGGYGLTEGQFVLGLTYNGDYIYLGSASNNASTTYVAPAIQWQSNHWYQVAVTYSPTNTAIYINGILAGTNGPGVTMWPSSSLRAQSGMRVGVDYYCCQSPVGQMDELETFNYPLTADVVSDQYRAVLAAHPNFDADGDGIPDALLLRLGGNPAYPTRTDINGLGQLKVYTPLR